MSLQVKEEKIFDFAVVRERCKMKGRKEVPDGVPYFLFLIVLMPPLDELVHASNLLFASSGLVEVMVQPLSGGNGCVPCPWRGEHLEAVVATRNLEVVN